MSHGTSHIAGIASLLLHPYLVIITILRSRRFLVLILHSDGHSIPLLMLRVFYCLQAHFFIGIKHHGL